MGVTVVGQRALRVAFSQVSHARVAGLAAIMMEQGRVAPRNAKTRACRFTVVFGAARSGATIADTNSLSRCRQCRGLLGAGCMAVAAILELQLDKKQNVILDTTACHLEISLQRLHTSSMVVVH